MRRRLPDLAIIALLFLLPIILFWQQTVGGRTLIPAENLYQYEPYAAYREQVGVPAIPYNHLVSDLVLQNYQWKSFILESLSMGEVPLWNPHQFSGIAFFAAGQQSTAYPFSLLYYILPLPAAYGWFTVIQLWLAGAFMYLFARGLGIGRAGGAVAGITYQLSGFFVVSAVFPMIIASAAWLPLILLMVEFVIRRQPALRDRAATMPWVAAGAVALGCNILAGHIEITYYTLIIAAYYAAARLIWILWRSWRESRQGEGDDLQRTRYTLSLRYVVGRGIALVAMIALGLALGALQFIPLFEAASGNFRTEAAPLEQVLEWAHPFRDVVQFAMPNFYGSPAQHGYFDVFSGQTVSLIDHTIMSASGSRLTRIDWGIKNYVEAALYVGILPLALAVFGGFASAAKPHPVSLRSTAPLRQERGKDTQPNVPLHKRSGERDGLRSKQGEVLVSRSSSGGYRVTFAVLAFFALTLMFGLPTYAVFYYLFPGINQLHSPFRWVFALTLSVAVLAGFGMDDLLRGDRRKLARGFGIALLGIGGLTLLGLITSRLFYPQIEPLLDRLWRGLQFAPDAFSDTAMFYSVQFTNALVFALMAVGSGIVFWRASRRKLLIPNPSPTQAGRGEQVTYPPSLNSGRGWGWGLPLAAAVLIALDLMIASGGFNPASDPAWLNFTPPAIEWLQDQPGEWRYTTLDDPAHPVPQLFNANMTLRYGLDDVRGYESIIPKSYVDFMQMLAPQTQLEFNRVAPIYTAYPNPIQFDYRDALESPLLDLLNVRYVVSHASTDINDVSGYELAYSDGSVNIWENVNALPRAFVTESDVDLENLATFVENRDYAPAAITRDTGRELFIDVQTDSPAQLIISQNFEAGWRAFLRPQGAGEDAENQIDLVEALGMAQAIPLEAGAWTVRVVYSPASFQIGAFGSIIGTIALLFALGVWAWRLYVGAGESTGIGRVARNSIAPILLNLFNRGIDMAFALVMLRVLGPADAGWYSYAIVIFGWFDIFTNFGLNLYLTREVARDRSRAGHFFLNTSLLRFVLALVGVPLLLGFLTVRDATVSPPLNANAVIAIGLLYVGLLPNSLSTGLTSLYYAFERAEMPAAVATVATMCKAVFGLVALLLGYGIIGLAGVSIITNVITLALLAWNGRDMIRLREGRADRSLMRRMIGESYPLMFNHFLANIFFQIDIIMIELWHTAQMLGQYSVAYKWVSALNVIPSFFTQALLPVMSRQARDDRDALKRTYVLAIKLLVSVALPIAVVFTFAAEFLAGVLGGAEYLPEGAIATQLMIWSIPIGWMNSLTQYVLIALDMQKRITTAFIVGVTFNIVTNALFIPQYGYQAAALTTIASEAVLLIPFALLLRREIGTINWGEMVWRPAVSAGAMLIVLLLGWSIQPLIALVVSALVYLGVLLALRPLNADERARLAPLIPSRLRRAAALFS